MKKKSIRSLTREIAMQHLYALEMQNKLKDEMNDPDTEMLFSLREENPCDLDEAYLSEVISLVTGHINEIDDLISRLAKNWKITRISKVDLSILRLSIGEIRYLDDIPLSASINEAVELAKKYGSEDSGKFINGILGKIVKE